MRPDGWGMRPDDSTVRKNHSYTPNNRRSAPENGSTVWRNGLPVRWNANGAGRRFLTASYFSRRNHCRQNHAAPPEPIAVAELTVTPADGIELYECREKFAS
jgi:hypothetical protein